MVLSQKMVNCTLLVRKRRPQETPRTHSRNHIFDVALEYFGVLPAVLEQVASERMDGHLSESGFPDKWRKTEQIFLHSTKSLRKWRIHLPILLWFCLSQKPFVICNTNNGWCHSVVEWCLVILECRTKKRNDLSNSTAKNSPGDILLPWGECSCSYLVS